MKSTTISSKRIWRRSWFWISLVLGLASGFAVIWQAQSGDYWPLNHDGTVGYDRIFAGWIIFLSVGFAVTLFFRLAWLSFPKRWNHRFLLLGVSIIGASGWQTFLLNWDVYEPSEQFSRNFLAWIGIWAFLFMSALLFLFSIISFVRWLFAWRILKLWLVPFTLLLCLVVGLRFAADWRGKRAWENYRREWQAKGEVFDLASLAPPAVPDNQNFAMAFIVSNSFAGCWNSSANHSERYESSALRMRLERTNCVLNTNTVVGIWQLSWPTKLKAWQDYYRTIYVTNEISELMPGILPGSEMSPPTSPSNAPAVFVEVLSRDQFPVADQPQSAAADVLLALSRYDIPLKALAEAGQRRSSRFPINYESPNPQLPHLTVLRECAAVLQLRAIANLEAGKSQAALSDIALILRLADSIRGEPVFSYIVRLTLVSMSIQPIWEGLAGKKWSRQELEILNDLLAGQNVMDEWSLAARGDRAQFIGLLEQQRQRRDETAGLLIVAVWPTLFEQLEYFLDCVPTFADLPGPIKRSLQLVDGLRLEQQIFRVLKWLPPDGWYEWNKVTGAKRIQERLDSFTDPSKLPFNFNVFLSAWEKTNIREGPHTANPHGALWVFVNLSVAYSGWRIASAQNAVDMARVGLALEQFRLDQGAYPDELSRLTPNYLSSVPPDVVNGKPLHYKTNEVGAFTLYSIGLNGKDDGGALPTNELNRFRFNLGDWIWRYPSTP